MTDPTPAGRIRALCDRISDLIEASIPTASVQRLSDTGGGSDGRWRAPLHHDTIDARDNLKQILTSWALLIVEERGVDYDSRDETTAIAAWTFQQADWLALHPAYDDFILEVEEAIDALARIVNRGVSARRPDLARAVHPEDTLNQDLTAEDCATALTQLHDHPITAKQILKLVEVDRRKVAAGTLHQLAALTPSGKDGRRPLFRVQEVLTRAKKSGCRSGQKAG
ncbi:hypothetical protein [Brevibacterium sp. CT2-23B]|uniref:hypothetical protein n=1 Tax=Brevibacterium sp. CT2-23B TaxID=2729630 RepID=UPI0015532E1C|nr:hypothetical protein [Brevibacterium sp. CT2-23B]